MTGHSIHSYNKVAELQENWRLLQLRQSLKLMQSQKEKYTTSEQEDDNSKHVILGHMSQTAKLCMSMTQKLAFL